MSATLNYQQIPGALERLSPFKGNSMSAGWEDPRHVGMGLLDEDERLGVREVLLHAFATGRQAYVVYSRVTPIAVALDDRRYLVRQRFSVTTTRQQNLTRCYLPPKGE